ncbi:MAG: DNA-binding domain-containing protein [Beijerinckiaceae bacterium]
MPQLAERQRGFAAALLDAALPVPTGLVGPDGKASAKRFAVYRNNVVVGLTETLKAGFPAVHRIVGAEFFQAMARTYAVVEPPRSPILLHYGAGFPEFIGQFEPAAVLPYLADVARIERTWTEAYHAPEASPINPADLAALAPEDFSAVRFQLHPSARLVRSQFPALTIWRMNVADGVPEPVDLAAGGEDVLVVRPAADVEARSIPGGAFEFVQALAAGATVLTAMKAALAADHRFDLSANLAGLMRAGALVGYDMEQASGASEIKRPA